MGKHLNVFVAYRGDELLAIGTISELAEILQVAKKTIHFWKTPAHLKRAGDGKRVKVFKVECGDFDEQTIDAKYKEVLRVCNLTHRKATANIKREMAEYFKLFKEEFQEQLERQEIKLTNKG